MADEQAAQATDEQGTEATQTDDTATTAADNVRETPAFRGVLKQLEDERKATAKLAREADKLRAEKEARDLAKNEEAGEYEAAKKALEDRALAAERKAQEIELRFQLAAADVRAPKAQKFLLAEFLTVGGDKPFDEWIAEAKEDAEYSMFFGSGGNAAPGARPPRTQGAATGNTSKDDLQVRAANGDREAQRKIFNEALGIPD